ncbi:unnamed protein product [Arabidopsis halleri]
MVKSNLKEFFLWALILLRAPKFTGPALPILFCSLL